MKKKKTLLKITFYFISLWLLFISAAIVSARIDLDDSFSDNFKNSIVSIIFIALAIGSFALKGYVKDKTKGSANPNYTIIKIENKNYEFLAYLTAYIIPLIFVDFNDKRYLIVLAIVLVFTGFVFTKMDLFLANPTLALFYKLYEIEVKIGSNIERITVISKDKLDVNDKIEWIPFDDKCWFVRRKEDEKS